LEVRREGFTKRWEGLVVAGDDDREGGVAGVAKIREVWREGWCIYYYRVEAN
jgi:hypothetical protein